MHHVIGYRVLSSVDILLLLIKLLRSSLNGLIERDFCLGISRSWHG